MKKGNLVERQTEPTKDATLFDFLTQRLLPTMPRCRGTNQCTLDTKNK